MCKRSVRAQAGLGRRVVALRMATTQISFVGTDAQQLQSAKFEAVV